MITLKCKECSIREPQYWARVSFAFPEEGKRSTLAGEFCENCIAAFVSQNNASFERIETL